MLLSYMLVCFKVVGGRRSDNGRLGAFITRVKPGSVADTIGRLRAGWYLHFS